MKCRFFEGTPFKPNSAELSYCQDQEIGFLVSLIYSLFEEGLNKIFF